MLDVFQFIILFAVALWTSRLAIVQGRNPWFWGGAVLLLGVIGKDFAALLGLVPAAVLMFMKAPAAPNGERPVRLACARCAQAHSAGQRFCTNCGWDLAEISSPDLTDAAHPVATSTQAPPVEQVQPTEAPASPPEAVPPATLQAETTVDVQPPPVEASGSVEVAEATAAEGTPPTSPETPEPEPAEAAPTHLWGLPEPGVAPTAAVMTDRGLERLRDGRIQEAIDQFTKAIALDPDYREAWEHRAAAYTKQGKNHEAEQDLRRVQGLNPGPTPG